VGFEEFQTKAPFAPSLFVEIRRRMGEDTFLHFNQAIVESVEKLDKKKQRKKEDKDDDQNNQGQRAKKKIEKEADKDHKLILDATVAPQAIRFPTDIDLLNRSREISEEVIDELYKQSDTEKKPRTYRQKARKDYLSLVKRRKPAGKIRRKGIRQQLQYLRRNLKHINSLLDTFPKQEIPLSPLLLKRYWVIQHVYNQQNEMYREKKMRCNDRIVSISQPHVRPIVRGKAHISAEFGAKLSVSLTKHGIAMVDRIGWDAFIESEDLKPQVEKYKEVHGKYPDSVLVDPIYGTQKNRKWLKEKGIRYCGKPLGRPRKETPENKEELQKEKKRRKEEYRERIPIEGKFGQGKNGYGLGYIRAKTSRTSESWIHSIFFVMNLGVLEKVFLLLYKIHAIYRKMGLYAYMRRKRVPIRSQNYYLFRQTLLRGI